MGFFVHVRMHVVKTAGRDEQETASKRVLGLLPTVCSTYKEVVVRSSSLSV
jgi:hypothetical protein